MLKIETELKLNELLLSEQVSDPHHDDGSIAGSVLPSNSELEEKQSAVSDWVRNHSPPQLTPQCPPPNMSKDNQYVFRSAWPPLHTPKHVQKEPQQCDGDEKRDPV